MRNRLRTRLDYQLLQLNYADMVTSRLHDTHTQAKIVRCTNSSATLVGGPDARQSLSVDSIQ